MRRILFIGSVVGGLFVVVLVLFWAGAPKILTQQDLERKAIELSGSDAIDCGRNQDYNVLYYPSPADGCAAAAFKAGKSFRVNGCYFRTDTAGCYWIAGTPTGSVYFILYTYYSMGDKIGRPYLCIECQDKPIVALCENPVVITHRDIETIQCPSFPSSWIDTFHINY